MGEASQTFAYNVDVHFGEDGVYHLEGDNLVRYNLRDDAVTVGIGIMAAQPTRECHFAFRL